MAAKPLTAAQQAVIDQINAEQAAAKKADVPLPTPVLQSTGLAGVAPTRRATTGFRLRPSPSSPRHTLRLKHIQTRRPIRDTRTPGADAGHGADPA